MSDENTTDTNAAPSLQLQDLVVLLQTIQVTAQRGAIRADEMSLVGGVYERLFAFLEAQGAVSRQAPAPSSEGAPNVNA
jgi:hypothetical protein